MEPAGRGGRRGGKAAPDGAARAAKDPPRRRAAGAPVCAAPRRRSSERKRLGEIDAELAEPHAYADRDILNRLLSEHDIVEGQLQREYADWEKLINGRA